MFLEDIIEKRKEQLEREKSKIPVDEIKVMAENAPKNDRSFKKSLSQKGLSVIAEVKKASPSKGLIQPDFHPVEPPLPMKKRELLPYRFLPKSTISKARPSSFRRYAKM